MEEQHLTINEAAASLRISRWTVSRYIASGELAAIKADGANGAVRIPLASLHDYIHRHTAAAATARGEAMNSPPPRLHALQDVAAQYGLKLRGLKERARRREFTHVQIGQGRYFTDEQLAAFLKANTVIGKQDDALAKTRDRVASRRRRAKRVQPTDTGRSS